MSAYVLARMQDGEWIYWLGRKARSGGVAWTPFVCDAKHFSSARCAYEAADTHPEIDQTEWRAIRRDRIRRRAA